MRKLVIGHLAHVDAGKTTLSEAMLYLSGYLKQLGRVDHQDAFLDYDGQERQRGITIYSKQAVFQWQDVDITLLDTPGHVDFSSEMERTLAILDAAILIISSTDGVQNHTKTIWKLLQYYQVPTFIFVNKMDMPGVNQQALLKDIQTQLDERCLDFSQARTTLDEEIALNSEHLLDLYLANNQLSDEDIAWQIKQRQIFPCFFGSALKLVGVDQLLNGIQTFVLPKPSSDAFSAQAYKITYDDKQQRWTHLKLTGGSLAIKELIDDEKVEEIRVYSGNKYEQKQNVVCGEVCAIRGPKHIAAGDVLGDAKKQRQEPLLSSCMAYRVLLPSDIDAHQFYPLLKQLFDEDPSLHISYDTQLNEIQVHLMGDIQIEILTEQIANRFGIHVGFDHGRILYKETIASPVLGVGHYEPLRHYAEVQLLLEPLAPGSGLVFASDCQEDQLAKHWQNLVLTHLKEKEHLGVLTGSPITDMKITLINGRFHLKHTEGGDFRQATYRAVRQGLKMAKSILLEPYYQFEAEIPNDCVSRFIYHMEERQGTYEICGNNEETTYLKGQAPIRQLQGYYQEILAYTKGKGKFSYTPGGYLPCLDQDEIVAQIGYDSETDLDNPTGSVFCSHGAGYTVRYDEVYNKMHLEAPLPKEEKTRIVVPHKSTSQEASDDDLTAIFERTYGPIEHKTIDQFGYRKKPTEEVVQSKPLAKCLLVDGYNVIHSWPELASLAKVNLDAARARLIDLLCNYQGYKQNLLILVFDAYLVKDNPGTIEKYHNIYIVYTKEAQTADMFIERTTHQMAKDFDISVVTSDALEQIIVSGQGALRISSREFKIEVEHTTKTKLADFFAQQKQDLYFPLEALKDYQHD